MAEKDIIFKYLKTCSRYPMKENNVTKQFSGEWLLLFNDEIVDHSSNVEEILKLAEEKFPSEKFPNDNIKISKVLTGDIHLH
jgi:hypothetical protein